MPTRPENLYDDITGAGHYDKNRAINSTKAYIKTWVNHVKQQGDTAVVNRIKKLNSNMNKIKKGNRGYNKTKQMKINYELSLLRPSFVRKLFGRK
jgi:hypothetical protein